jgi:hypothetical protein
MDINDANVPFPIGLFWNQHSSEILKITSSVRGEQPSQLSSIMPPHSTSRLQLMPPTQNSSSSTSLVQRKANTHVLFMTELTVVRVL